MYRFGGGACCDKRERERERERGTLTDSRIKPTSFKLTTYRDTCVQLDEKNDASLHYIYTLPQFRRHVGTLITAHVPYTDLFPASDPKTHHVAFTRMLPSPRPTRKRREIKLRVGSSGATAASTPRFCTLSQHAEDLLHLIQPRQIQLSIPLVRAPPLPSSFSWR